MRLKGTLYRYDIWSEQIWRKLHFRSFFLYLWEEQTFCWHPLTFLFNKRFQKHVETGTFGSVLQNDAEALLERRTDAIQRLRAAKAAGESAADINKDLQSIDVEIKKFVRQSVGGRELPVIPSREEISVLETREFPYFYFPKPKSL